MSQQTSWLNRLRNYIDPRLLVLMYHRVAEVDFDPWDLCVSPLHFEQQLQWLQKTNRVISANQLISDFQTGKLTERGIVLTFDDGYTDNFTVAKPLLEKYGLPATFFLTTHPIINQQAFWWDELQWIICETPILPPRLSLSIAGEHITVDIGDEVLLTPQLSLKQHAWKATNPPVSKRCSLYLQLWQKLRPLPHTNQQQIIQYLREWSGCLGTATASPPIMSLPQVNELINHSLIDLGVHTLSHPALAEHPQAFQHTEIVDSKSVLEGLCKRPIYSFSYPYGNYNELTQELLETANFSIAFTTQAIPTTIRTNRYQVGRLQVPNCTGQQLQKRLNQIL